MPTNNKKQRGLLIFNIFLTVIAVSALIISLSGFGGKEEEESPQPVYNLSSNANTSTDIDAQTGLKTLENMQYSFRAVAKKVLPTVVEINVVDIIKQPIPQFLSPFEFFFGQPNPREQKQWREYKQYGLGSGVIVRKVGKKIYVLTNNHVVGEADEISVRLHDGRQYKARLVGKDANKDLALVVFESSDKNIPIAELGDSSTLQVGDWVLAIGNPLGFESTVTAGIVSAIGRHSLPGSHIAGFTDYIQTDAAINRGNSGGALVNLKGQVIGINTWIASPSGGSIGLGFAIPINNAKKAINDFITKGKIEYGWLGVSIGDASKGYKEDLKIEDKTGAFVFNVFKGSPADKAGILPGDLITKVNGKSIKDSTQLLFTIGNLQPGKKTEFEIYRQGKTVTLTAKLATREEEKKLAKKSNKVWPGITPVKITNDIRKQLGIPSGIGKVIIGNVVQGSPAQIAGLRIGDIIKRINNNSIDSVADFYKYLNENDSKRKLFTIVRNGNELIIGLVK